MGVRKIEHSFLITRDEETGIFHWLVQRGELRREGSDESYIAAADHAEQAAAELENEAKQTPEWFGQQIPDQLES